MVVRTKSTIESTRIPRIGCHYRAGFYGSDSLAAFKKKPSKTKIRTTHYSSLLIMRGAKKTTTGRSFMFLYIEPALGTKEAQVRRVLQLLYLFTLKFLLG